MQPRFDTIAHSRKVARVQIQRIQSRVTETEADAVVVGVFEETPLERRRGRSRRGAGRRDSRPDRAEGIHRPQLRDGARCWSPVGRARQALVVGLGQREDVRRRRGVSLLGRRRASTWPASRARAWPFFSTTAGRPNAPKAACAARSSAARAKICIAPKRIAIRSTRWPGPAAAEQAIASGRILGESVNLTRRLVNEPADEIYPETFAAASRRSRRAKRPGNRNLGSSSGWRPNAAARCWPWPRARAARRGW